MIVLTFKSQFAPKVRDGSKKQTIRPERKRPVMIGDKLSLRIWSGLPYRSHQTILLESEIIEVNPISIFDAGFQIYAPMETIEFWQTRSMNCFAKADGFDSWDDMVKWFAETHGLPFLGALIKWI